MPADAKTPDAKTPDSFSLRRWSRRKLEAARDSAPTEPVPPVTPTDARDGHLPIAANPGASVAESPSGLPPVESLTIDSDFTAYLQPQVDESLKRQALKKLFSDPRFNVMDGLDVYIDDYTKSDPIPPDVLEMLMKRQFTFNPPVASDESPIAPKAEQPADASVAAPLPAAEPAAATPPARREPASPPATVIPSQVPDATSSSSASPPEAPESR